MVVVLRGGSSRRTSLGVGEFVSGWFCNLNLGLYCWGRGWSTTGFSCTRVEGEGKIDEG